MTYKLNPWVNLIVSPLVVRFGTQVQEFDMKAVSGALI